MVQKEVLPDGAAESDSVANTLQKKERRIQKNLILQKQEWEVHPAQKKEWS